MSIITLSASQIDTGILLGQPEECLVTDSHVALALRRPDWTCTCNSEVPSSIPLALQFISCVAALVSL